MSQTALKRMSGIFSEAFSNATRSITDNYALVKKIYLPRELFPVASVLVSFVHFLPQLFVLVLGCLFTGWSPNLAQIIGGVGGFLLLAAFVLGLGLVFGALNVLYRDFENLVDLILVVATWASPVLYTWTLVTDAIGTGWLWWLYQSNPLTTVVEIFHWCFWAPTTSAPLDFPPGFPAFLAIAVAVTALTVATGQLIFRRLDGRFAQEL